MNVCKPLIIINVTQSQSCQIIALTSGNSWSKAKPNLKKIKGYGDLQRRTPNVEHPTPNWEKPVRRQFHAKTRSALA